jgi:hypothetical protein
MEYKKIRSGPHLSDYCGATDSPRPASRSPARPCPGTAFVDAARWAEASGIAAMSAGPTGLPGRDSGTGGRSGRGTGSQSASQVVFRIAECP